MLPSGRVRMKLPKFVPEIVLATGTLVEVSSAVTQALDFVDSGKIGIVFYGIAIPAGVLSLCAGLYILSRSRSSPQLIAASPAEAANADLEEAAPARQVPENPSQGQRKIGCSVQANITLTLLSALSIIFWTASHNSTGLPTAARPPTATEWPATASTEALPTTPIVTAVPPLTTSANTVPPTATFTMPSVGQTIRAGSSIAVAGTADNLGGKSLWLMTKRDGGGYYFTSKAPVAVSDGDWRFLDTEAGVAADVGEKITYFAISANSSCYGYLISYEGSDSVEDLPAGCNVLADVAVNLKN